MNTPIRIALVGLVTLSMACSDDDSPIEPSSSSSVHGRVDGDSSARLEGAAITLAQVQADGSLSTVSSQTVSSDASGGFTVSTALDGVRQLVAVATTSTSEWQAVVSAEVSHGATVSAPPINTETTVEAHVYAEVTASGDTGVSFSDIAAYVTDELATEVEGDVGATETLAVALAAEAEAEAAVATSSTVGATSSQLQAATDAVESAQVAFEAALDAAGGSQSMVDAAVEAHHHAVINAYVSAGVSASGYAKALEASANAMLRTTVDLSASAQLALRRQASTLRAYAIDAAVQAQLTAVSASQGAKDEVSSASASLLVSIEAAVTPTAILTAFDAYHDEVLEQLTVSMSAQTSAVVSVDAAINASAGIKATFATQVSAAVSTVAVINAYQAFYDAVRIEVESTLTGASATEVSAATDILIVANVFL